MKKIFALSIVLLLSVSLASGCIGGGDDDGNTTSEPPTTNPATTNPSMTTNPPSANGNYNWELYDFEVGDSFTYDVAWNSPDFNMGGMFSIDFQPCATHEYQVNYYGTYSGTMSGNFNSTFKTDEDEFYERFMENMISTNAMISPLFMFTLIAPWWGPFFSENEIYLGSSWSMTIEGNTSTFNFNTTCSHAGLQGVLGKYTFSGQGMTSTIEACINPEFPLALYSEYRFDEGSEIVSYSSELIDWSI